VTVKGTLEVSGERSRMGNFNPLNVFVSYDYAQNQDLNERESDIVMMLIFI
jgi:hypothetical protein